MEVFMAQIHAIGEPENDAERKAIRRIAHCLPDEYIIFHNFELTHGRRGFPYEYDMAVIGEFAVYHVEVKGYRGAIRGNAREWIFENGGVYPSPIPLANKKTKILASKLRQFSRHLNQVFVETVILLADDQASARLRDEQSNRVVNLQSAASHLTDRRVLPHTSRQIEHLHPTICEALFGTRPAQKTQQIGLYAIIEKINQTDTRSVFIAEHRYIKTYPKTILKVYQFDPYASAADKDRQIRSIFHDPEAMRMMPPHPNIIRTSDMFAWEHDKFVLPTEYLEHGRTLETLLDRGEDRQMTWAMKREVITQVAKGLRHAHRSGIIHRDVRPLSVVVAPENQVKLVNFDLAFIRQAPELSAPLHLRRRLHRSYTAPEVWRDPASASAASDVYSLGLLFYALITHTPPAFDVETVIDTQTQPIDPERLLHELSTPGSQDFMEAPLDAVDIIHKMCALNPNDRYASMDSVLEDLSIVGD
jgi:tRNA A-37 threonylcarbamoyl transferase component Bud32